MKKVLLFMQKKGWIIYFCIMLAYWVDIIGITPWNIFSVHDDSKLIPFEKLQFKVGDTISAGDRVTSCTPNRQLTISIDVVPYLRNCTPTFLLLHGKIMFIDCDWYFLLKK